MDSDESDRWNARNNLFVDWNIRAGTLKWFQFMGRLKKIEDVGENSGYLEETANAWNICCDFYIHLYKRSFESVCGWEIKAWALKMFLILQLWSEF